jgi:LmbE family N-acetylglucosaminyl deacetylase
MTMDALLGAKRILVLAPHPDDEALGCGGTIALSAAKGAEVHVAVISDGGKMFQASGGQDGIVALRKKEAHEACGVLGVKEVSFLDYPDGDLRLHENGIKADIEGLIDRFRPEIVLSTSPLDYHEDHIAVAKIAAETAARREGISLVFFQVAGTLRFNALVDIGSVMETKESAIRCYRHSLFDEPELFAEAVKGTSRFWSFYTRALGYYEAFFVVPSSFGMPEIIRWMTYGEKELSPEEIYLSQLKAVDELLAEEKTNRKTILSLESSIVKLQAEAAGREELIAGLNADIASKTESLGVISRDVEALAGKLDMVSGSFFWRLATIFYKVRDRLLPENSSRRKAYDRLVALIKQ